MRFPAQFWIRVGGERYRAKRVTRLKGRKAECDHAEMFTVLRTRYPTGENELVSTLHENTHQIIAEYGISCLEEAEGDEKDEADRKDADVDRIAQGRAQFIHSLIEQDILAWGPAMIPVEKPPEKT